MGCCGRSAPNASFAGLASVPASPFGHTAADSLAWRGALQGDDRRHASGSAAGLVFRDDDVAVAARRAVIAPPIDETPSRTPQRSKRTGSHCRGQILSYKATARGASKPFFESAEEESSSAVRTRLPNCCRSECAVNRRTLFRASAVLGATALGTARPAGAQPIPAPRKASQFFHDADMNFVYLGMLGAAYYGATDVGTALAIIDQTEDGNAASAFAALTSNGERVREMADAALAAGHRATAREAYLQASNYTFAATYFCDRMGAPDRLVPAWKRSRTALDAAFDLFDRPVERIKIPYEGGALPGYFFKVDDTGKQRPLLILTNGSDGSVLDMLILSGAAGLDRGYNCLVYDGPGQGAALWEQHLTFRPDWEKVVTPVVDFALRRREVDPQRIALQGISQGGYWVPRAVAYEHRIAAAIADPGVFDVSTSWTEHLPPQVIALLDGGQKAQFDRVMTSVSAAQAKFAFRARPFGISSPFDLFTAVRAYTLAGVLDKVRCPVLITDPDGEQFWPGQSRQVYDGLQSPKALVRFTVAEGADLHCEPLAPGLRAQRIFDWLDTTLAKRSR